MTERKPFETLLNVLEGMAKDGVSQVRVALERQVKEGVPLTREERRKALAWARGLNVTADLVTEILSGATAAERPAPRMPSRKRRP